MRRNTIRTLCQQAIGVGIEDDQQDKTAEVIINVAVNSEDPIEEKEIEVADASDETEEAVEAVDELDEAAATLESIQELLLAHKTEGGLDPMAAQYLHIAVAGVCDRIGLENAVPSLESFGGATDRLAATNISLEAVSDKAKAVWQAIKNAVLKAVEFLRNFFAKLFGGYDKLGTRAAELIKAAEGAAGKTASGKVKIGVAGRLTIDKKFSAGSIKQAIENLDSRTQHLYGTYLPKLEKFVADATKETTLPTALQAEVSTGEIAGGVMVVAKSVIGDSVFVPALERESTKVAEIAEDQEFDPLSVADIKTIAGQVQSFATKVKKDKDASARFAKAVEAAVAAMESRVKAGSSTGLKPSDLPKLTNGAISFANRLGAEGYKISRAALTACERSLAAYGAKKAEDKK